ncbi:MAG TPA: DUF4124 domain-containing protein [Methylomirabilota bacterium]|jgi:hypothetical protein
MEHTRGLLAVSLGIMALLPFRADAAGMYKWTAADGTVTYSDRPQPPAPEPATPEPTTPAAPVTPATPPGSPAREGAPKPAATVDEVLEMSGVKPQLAVAPAKMASEFKPRRPLNAEDTAALEAILARNFAGDRLYSQIRTEFRRRADGRKLAEVAAWLRSPLGEKITAVEVAAGLEADAGQRMVAFAPGGRGGPGPARVALMERIDWTAGVTDGALESMLAVARAMAMAINRALPPDERQTSAQIERHLQQLRGQSRAKLAQSTITFMLYQYRGLDDDELQQYADFLASDAGRWYSATMSKAMNRTVAAAAQRAASEAIRAIPPPRWAGGVAASPRH